MPMLIQTRGPRLRLVRQHDHGLLAGELAAAWRGVEGDEALDRVVVLATALHDLGWRELDEVPLLDPETGRPYDFLSLPSDAKFDAAAVAIDELEELHPYAAVLVSLHYGSLGTPHRPAEFDEEEGIRRAEILDDMGDEAPGPRRIRGDLETLQLFDNLSLFLCLTPPDADPGTLPSWLTPDLLAVPREQGENAVPGGRNRPEDAMLDMTWRDVATVELTPFPFGGEPLGLELPFREIPASRYRDQEALERVWRDAPEEVVTIRIEPGAATTRGRDR